MFVLVFEESWQGRARETIIVHDRFEKETAALRRAEEAERIARDAIALAKEMRLAKEAAERRAAMITEKKEESSSSPTKKKHENLTMCFSLDEGRECVEPELQFETSTRVHLVPPDSPKSGWRFQHLVKMGLRMHPSVVATESSVEADLVLYMPISTKIPPVDASGARTLVVLDEGDGSGYWASVHENSYLLYLKRSWVTKRDGAYTGIGKRYTRNYYPLAYSVSDSYFDSKETKRGDERHIDIVCSNRPRDRQPTRTRVVQWVADFLDDNSRRYNGIAGEVNAAGRRTIDDAYFGAMRSAKIVVTCNPSHWEGDFRTFEALASGALVFVDEMYVPHPRPFVHEQHVVVYDNSDPEDFVRKLTFYLEHPDLARKIAIAGLRHALRYHRAVSRMDYVLRSAHELLSPAAASRYTHTAKQIAFDVNATTQIDPVLDPKDPSVNKPKIPAKLNLGRRFRTKPLSQEAIDNLVKRNLQQRIKGGKHKTKR